MFNPHFIENNFKKQGYYRTNEPGFSELQAGSQLQATLNCKKFSITSNFPTASNTQLQPNFQLQDNFQLQAYSKPSNSREISCPVL